VVLPNNRLPEARLNDHGVLFEDFGVFGEFLFDNEDATGLVGNDIEGIEGHDFGENIVGFF